MEKKKEPSKRGRKPGQKVVKKSFVSIAPQIVRFSTSQHYNFFIKVVENMEPYIEKDKLERYIKIFETIQSNYSVMSPIYFAAASVLLLQSIDDVREFDLFDTDVKSLVTDEFMLKIAYPMFENPKTKMSAADKQIYMVRRKMELIRYLHKIQIIIS